MAAKSKTSSASNRERKRDWRGSSSSVLDANQYMFDHQPSTSCKASTTRGDRLAIGGHRYVLCSRSPVFNAMLTGPLASCSPQSKPPPPGTVEEQLQQQQDQFQTRSQPTSAKKTVCIDDIDSNVFSKLLRYIYYEKVELTDDTVFHVLYAARKYLVLQLVDCCVTYLDRNLTAKNVCVYLENACLFEHDQPGLLLQCQILVKYNTKAVFSSESFADVSNTTLCRLLQSDGFQIPEVDVFLACIRWAEQRCARPTPTNLRKMLGDALKLIHIPAMTVKEFTNTVIPTGLLSSDEENAVFRWFHRTDSAARSVCNDSKATELPFPTQRRYLPLPSCHRRATTASATVEPLSSSQP